MKSSFIDTSSGALVPSARALELAGRKRDLDLEKLSFLRSKEFRRIHDRSAASMQQRSLLVNTAPCE